MSGSSSRLVRRASFGCRSPRTLCGWFQTDFGVQGLNGRANGAEHSVCDERCLRAFRIEKGSRLLQFPRVLARQTDRRVIDVYAPPVTARAPVAEPPPVIQLLRRWNPHHTCLPAGNPRRCRYSGYVSSSFQVTIDPGRRCEGSQVVGQDHLEKDYVWDRTARVEQKLRATSYRAVTRTRDVEVTSGSGRARQLLPVEVLHRHSPRRPVGGDTRTCRLRAPLHRPGGPGALARPGCATARRMGRQLRPPTRHATRELSRRIPNQS